MARINLVAVLGAAVLAFVIGGLWYSPLLFGRACLALRGLDAATAREAAMPVGEMVGEFGRWLLITGVLAASMPRVGVEHHADERRCSASSRGSSSTPPRRGVGAPRRTRGAVYASHAGDGLAELVTITAIHRAVAVAWVVASSPITSEAMAA